MIQKVLLYTNLLLKLSYKTQFLLPAYLLFCLLSFLVGFSAQLADYEKLMPYPVFIYLLSILFLDSSFKNEEFSFFREIHGIQRHIVRLSKFLLVNVLFCPFGISRINDPFLGLYYVGFLYLSGFSVSFLCPFGALVLAGVVLFFVKTGASFIFILSYVVFLTVFTVWANFIYK